MLEAIESVMEIIILLAGTQSDDEILERRDQALDILFKAANKAKS